MSKIVDPYPPRPYSGHSLITSDTGPMQCTVLKT